MRVQGPQGHEPQNVPNATGPGRAAGPETRTPATEAHLSASCRPYIAKALSGDGFNVRAVREARRMLAAGQLDTPDAVQRAAQRMADLGI